MRYLIVLSGVVVSAALYLAWRRQSRYLWPYLTATLVTAVYYLANAGYEGPWYPLDRVLQYRAEVPFGHRLLFVWIANGLKAVAPGHAPKAYYVASQIPALLAAGYALIKLAERFTDQRTAKLAPLLGFLVWVPTLSYYTFYDIAIIAFVAGLLSLAYDGSWIRFSLLFALATLNHEIVLLVLPVATLIYAFSARGREAAGFFLLNLAVYTVLRAILFTVMPQPAAFIYQVPVNFEMLGDRPLYVLRYTAGLIIWLLIAATALPRAPARIRPALLLFPFLLLSTFVVGHLYEARQFDAFIPVAVTLILVNVSSVSKTSRWPLLRPLRDPPRSLNDRRR